MPLFLTQLRFELLKMFSRKRTYIGFGAFLRMEALVLFIFNLPKPKASFRRLIEQNGYGFDEYYSGFTLAMLIVLWTTTLLGSLYLALVAGDLMAKEIEEGTMRMLLCRPISRLRVTLLKYLAAIIYTFVLIGFIGVTALLAGLAYRGFGGLFVVDPAGTHLRPHPARARPRACISTASPCSPCPWPPSAASASSSPAAT